MRIRYITHAARLRPVLSYKQHHLNHLLFQSYNRGLHHLTKVAAQELDHYAKVELEKSISKVCISINSCLNHIANHFII